jgi:hypothetical protein
MGFYVPAQIVLDARAHGVEAQPMRGDNQGETVIFHLDGIILDTAPQSG